jgi:hypothetical protein
MAACQFPSFTVGSGGEGGGAVSSSGSDSGEAPNVPGSGGTPSVADPCLDDPCQNDGRCVATLAGSTVCLCEPGFRGDFCEAAFDNCDPDPCLNGGECFDGDDAAFCMCPEGWEGATCERDHDDCADDPCLNGGVCSDGFMSRTCACSSGFSGESCEDALLPTCRAIYEVAPDATDGVYTVDPDGPGMGNPPFDVLCKMTNEGWTMVGQERQGTAGTFKYLGVSVGDVTAAAKNGDNALAGEQFKGLYEEVWLTWSSATDVGNGIYFRIQEEMFSNSVHTALPVSDFFSTDPRLQGWVSAAGGAVLCRASQSPDVRPGDSSWAIKPRNDSASACGCNSQEWVGRGAFYGGHSDSTLCNPSGGGWAAVTDNGQPKGGVEDWSLQIWVR